MLTVRKENNRFQLKSGDKWTLLAERLKTLADVKEFFNTENVEMVSQAGLPYRTIEVSDYDGLHLTIKEGSEDKKIYFPTATEKEIITYLTNDGTKEGFDKVVIKFSKPIKEPVNEPKTED